MTPDPSCPATPGSVPRRPLRSNFEPGTTRWAVQRAQWRALGIRPDDMTKPKIGVVNSSSGLSICFAHLDQVSEVVQKAIRDAGGLPFEIHTAAPSDFITSAGREGRYLMPTRDLVVNDIEVAVEGAVLDGIICLASCDKTTPAHLMAAGRLDVPAIVVICGYQTEGRHNGRRVGIEDVYEAVGGVVAGRLTADELGEMADHAITAPGVCAGLGTANTMHILCETLGMALPGSAPIRGGSSRMEELAAAAGRRIVELVEADIRPRSIMTPQAFDNAVMVDVALGGSVNSIRHLQAIAAEADVDVDVFELLERRSGQLPLLCSVRPNGSHSTEDLERAGGARALMKQLAGHLHLGAGSVAGGTIGEALADVEVGDEEVIRPLARPASPRPGLAMLRGTLAPDGALVKLAGLPDGVRRFDGPASVFESERDAIAAMSSGAIAAGSVAVLRGMGPKGGPGTVFAASFVAALRGAGLHDAIAVVTDGELSGLNAGFTVGQVMPEAAEGGPLAAVREGDRIVIDLEQRRLDLEVAVDEVEQRLAGWRAPTTRDVGWLGLYASLVQPLSQGAVLRAGDDRRANVTERPHA